MKGAASPDGCQKRRPVTKGWQFDDYTRFQK